MDRQVRPNPRHKKCKLDLNTWCAVNTDGPATSNRVYRVENLTHVYSDENRLDIMTSHWSSTKHRLSPQKRVQLNTKPLPRQGAKNSKKQGPGPENPFSDCPPGGNCRAALCDICWCVGTFLWGKMSASGGSGEGLGARAVPVLEEPDGKVPVPVPLVPCKPPLLPCGAALTP